MVTATSKILPDTVSILIILMGSLGDVARGLCLVSHVKNHFPKSRITWLVEPMCSELIGLHPMIDKTIIFNRAKNIFGVWDLYKALSKENFDITLDLQRHFKSGFFSFLSRAERRIGFNRYNTKEWNWIFNNEHIEYASGEIPKLYHYLKFTEHLGLPEPASLAFGFSSLNGSRIRPEIIAQIEGPFIAVVLGSSWESKNWFFEGYYRLVKNILSEKSRRVLLIGDRSQTSSAEELYEKVGSPDLINLVGKTSIPELVAVLKAAVAGVGPDSGPGHLAAAVGTPFVTLFGPTAPAREAPYQCDHLVVQSDISCVACYKKKCPDLDRQCMKRISPETVLEKLSVYLGEVDSD